jgi:membrane protease YdiL (CAAX protease family)
MAARAVRLSGWPMALLMSVIYTAGMAGVWQFAEHDYAQTAQLLRDVLIALAVLVLLTLGIGWWSRLRIHRSNRIGWFGMLAVLPVMLVLITFVASASSGFTDRGLIILVLVGTLLVGIGEETAYRGVVLNSLAARMSLPWAVVVSSVLFGLMHSVNVLLQPVGSTIGQVVTTSLIGLFLGFTYVISGGNLVLVVVLHWLWDFGLIAAEETLAPVVGWVGGATVLILVLAMVGTGYGFIKMAGARWDES